MTGVVNMSPPKARTKLLAAYDVMERTGLSYECALAVIKANGIHIGKRYYITEAALEGAVNGYGNSVERVKRP